MGTAQQKPKHSIPYLARAIIGVHSGAPLAVLLVSFSLSCDEKTYSAAVEVDPNFTSFFNADLKAIWQSLVVS